MSPSWWCGWRPPHVPTRSSFLTPSWIELLEDDRRARAAHSRSLHGDRLALPRARVAEQAALGVPLDDVVQVGLGDVLRPQRVARKEARLGVLARLRSDVDRHPRDPIRAGSGAWRTSSSRPLDQILALLRGGPGRARLPRGRRPPRARPLRRARGGRAARRALPHRRERRPVRPRLRRLRRRDRRGRGADADRRAGGGDRALGGGAPQAARARGRTGPGQPVYAISDAPAAGRDAVCARRSSTTSTCSCRRARGRTRSSSGSTRSRATPTASAGARARRSRRAARGSGPRTASSSSRPRRRPGRPQAVQLQQVWIDPAARGRATATAGCAT